MRELKAAIVQMKCFLGDKEKNFEKAERMSSEAAAKGAELIILPELFSTGYRVEAQDAALAEPIPGATTDWMCALAAKCRAYIVGAIIEAGSDGILYDTAVLVGPEGYIGKQRKMHLWGGESERFGHGQDIGVFKLPFATIGMLICYEVGFPEMSRVQTLQGAELIVYTSAFGKARRYVWETASAARALENGVFVLACNRTGTEADTVLGGVSRIIAPDTRVLAQAEPDEETVIMATLDLDEVAESRRTIPYLRDLNDKLVPYYFKEEN